MSKNKVSRRGKSKSTRARRKKHVIVGALGLAILLSLGTVAGPWRDTRGAKHIRALFWTPPPPIPPANNPSKEYIYAGGKLVATEAPVTLLAPTNVAALTLSNENPARVSISWTATPGADHYQVERTTNLGGNYTVVNSNVATTTFTDNTVTSVTAYLYRVRAVDGGGNLSPYSNLDVATAITFTDDTIVTGSTLVKAAHINELRQAVDAVRATANLGAANWGAAITAGVTTVQADHIQTLRTNLDQARGALSLSACSYTNVGVGFLIQKNHIDELRQCVR
ncbi:MAG TPA: fibronectin type III domain-containing protein [Pyrinomonadaceae bacterium]|nr:fibronectin type III domain-containing protein [Pyrinomonadaceae bacterium]